MKVYDKILNLPDELVKYLYERYCDGVFFDIETTGFVPANSSLYLIGCAYFEDKVLHLSQWFLDTPEDEENLICAFLDFCSGFSKIIHYNGAGFDIPYIIKKCAIYHIPCDFSHLKSIDIYKLITPYKDFLKLPGLKQKQLEDFMGISRKDEYSGGELIKVYNAYISSPSDKLLMLLLLHNYEDVLGMLKIVSVLNYIELANGNFTVSDFTVTDSKTASDVTVKEAIITLKTAVNIPVRISNGNDNFYLTACGDTAKICVRIHTDELKYFYPNYKDYYYLPAEDCSIHKSVAFYVDKNYRTKAKAADCYSKKTGTFLPQYRPLFEPYFKIDYMDTITYFELTDDFSSDNGRIKEYAAHIIATLAKKQ